MELSSPPQFRAAIISMPWAIFNRPSIQLGALKGYVEKHSPYKVDTFHPYLDIAAAIGTSLYGEIALSGWGGEALFAPLLHANKIEDASHLFHSVLASGRKSQADFNQLTEAVKIRCTQWIESHDFSNYRLAGFSVCFSQLFASLYMARLLKQHYPDLVVVFGGSSCVGEVGRSLLQTYDEIDFIIDGEGEERLLNLCRWLDEKTGSLLQGIHGKGILPQQENQPAVLDLNDLPLPDYSDYFQEMALVFRASPFIPTLPVEFSRGCWWNRCTFCNLNIQWHDYRFKAGQRMLSEVLALTKKFESLNFTFTDNALPPADADIFFNGITKEKKDLRFFAEIRTTAKPERLENYRHGGLTTVQVGIEAVSSSLLGKMQKGSSTMDNIAMMKLCMQQGIRLEGNLILEFPGSTREEAEETLANLEYLLPFTPLFPATFFLGYGSPVFQNLKSFSIKNLSVHPKNRLLFPKEHCSTMTMLINSYRGDRARQKKLWQPVRKSMAEWRAFHERRDSSAETPLSYRDGEDFLIIRQEQPRGTTLHHRLRSLSRKVYLAAATPVSVGELHQRFPQLKEASLEGFIDEMCDKRLMFREGDKTLALAIQQH